MITGMNRILHPFDLLADISPSSSPSMISRRIKSTGVQTLGYPSRFQEPHGFVPVKSRRPDNPQFKERGDHFTVSFSSSTIGIFLVVLFSISEVDLFRLTRHHQVNNIHENYQCQLYFSDSSIGWIGGYNLSKGIDKLTLYS
jgi:hypothetical protein